METDLRIIQKDEHRPNLNNKIHTAFIRINSSLVLIYSIEIDFLLWEYRVRMRHYSYGTTNLFS